jgi:hypothetical protein
MLYIIISVLINIVVTIGILLIGLKINSAVMTHILKNTEDRIDRKLNLENELRNHTINKWFS